ncbi:LacI family DNA-binding transcriptional regulator [Orbus mooreae]|uniref:LacI family DNA-binding transcriptional regulator n=1 Tax=Orbus mooreae TaxID=3074107 RepID=UPI00370DA181
MASLKDVEKLANVSLMTVSRAINEPHKLNEKTLLKVNNAINQLDYVPHISPKIMRGDKSSPLTIGVLALDTATTPFSVEILQAIEKTAQSHNWITFTINLFDTTNLNEAVDTLLSYRPKGIIYTSMGLRKITIPEKLLQQNIVLANCLNDNGNIPCYIPDDFQGQYIAMKKVIEKGYKKPLCIYLSKTSLAGEIRRKAVEKAWLESGYELNDLTTYHLKREKDQTELNYLEVISIIDKHCTTKPNFDIIICGNDRVAFVVYQELLSRGFHIPSDVAVLGYDNMAGVGDLFSPALTTVQLPHYEIGQRAALHIINNEQSKTIIKIESPFLKRDSI